MTSSAPSKVERLGVGVVGLGSIGIHHVRALVSSSNGILAGMCDPIESCRKHALEIAEAPTYGDFDDLLANDSVHVVSICLPHDLHAPFALRAMEAGKHVIVEKPLALTVAQCDELDLGAKRFGCSLGVSHNELFYPPHERAKQLVESGELGEPVLLRMRLAADGPYGGWRSDVARTGGGILFDAGVHRLYVAMALFGPITKVHAHLDRARGEGEQFALLGLEFASGSRGIIEANFLAPDRYFDDSIEIVCTKGGLFIAGIESQYVGFRRGPSLLRFEHAEWREEPTGSGGWEESISRSVDAFLESVVKGALPPVGVAQGREVIALLETVYREADEWRGRLW